MFFVHRPDQRGGQDDVKIVVGFESNPMTQGSRRTAVNDSEAIIVSLSKPRNLGLGCVWFGRADSVGLGICPPSLPPTADSAISASG